MAAEESFNPRTAALQYAGRVEASARSVPAEDEVQLVADGLHAVVCGLVYVGDQVQRQNALLAVLAGPGKAEDHQAIADQLVASQARRF